MRVLENRQDWTFAREGGELRDQRLQRPSCDGSVTKIRLPQLPSRSRTGVPDRPRAKIRQGYLMVDENLARPSFAFCKLNAVTSRHQPSRER
jgi:hypothetical protein